MGFVSLLSCPAHDITRTLLVASSSPVTDSEPSSRDEMGTWEQLRLTVCCVLAPLGIVSGLYVAIHHQFMLLSFTFTGFYVSLKCTLSVFIDQGWKEPDPDFLHVGFVQRSTDHWKSRRLFIDLDFYIIPLEYFLLLLLSSSFKSPVAL